MEAARIETAKAEAASQVNHLVTAEAKVLASETGRSAMEHHRELWMEIQHYQSHGLSVQEAGSKVLGDYQDSRRYMDQEAAAKAAAAREAEVQRLLAQQAQQSAASQAQADAAEKAAAAAEVQEKLKEQQADSDFIKKVDSLGDELYFDVKQNPSDATAGLDLLANLAEQADDSGVIVEDASDEEQQWRSRWPKNKLEDPFDAMD